MMSPSASCVGPAGQWGKERGAVWAVAGPARLTLAWRKNGLSQLGKEREARAAAFLFFIK